MPIPFLSSIGLNKNEVQDFKVFNLASDPTLTSGGDYGYFWLNTTNSGGTIPTLKWWDGTNVRSLVDSTNIGSFTSGLATDLAGGGAGQIVYQDGANDTKFLAAGTAGQVLSSNGASAPSWVNQSSLAAGTAANISGGLAGQLLYQSALATTAKLTIGTAGQALVVNSGATAPEWVDQSTLSVGSATNKPGGSVGDILVQSGSGSTGFLNVGTNGQVITSNGLSPQYVNQSTLSVGSATTSGTATNIAGGAANRIPYQTAAGTTAFITDAANAILTTNASSVPALTAATNVTVGKAVDIALGAAGDLLYQSASNDTSFLNIGANGSILTSTGTAPQWSASIPSGSVSGLAASATTDTTNAGNISSGTLGLARLSLATDQFYVGDASNNPAATAKSSIRLSGFGTPNADVAMGGYKLTGLGAPTASTDAATMGYVDSVAQGLDVKASCKVGTIANITLSGPGASIDGISLSVDDRVLVKDQTDKKENGIYLWKGAAAAMVRSPDADTVAKLTSAFTFVEQGTNADSGWVCTVDSGTIGSVNIEWLKFSQAGSYTQGRGMVLDGTAFNFAQNTNYTADTIPYASGATTIGFIGAGTADQVLRVPGAGGTPAFGAIDLSKSAAVTGALPIANGGTGATSFTQGQVLFAGASTISSSANLFWDNGTNRLGIGTATPAASLQVGTRSSSALANNSSIFTAGGASASAGTTVAATFANTVAAAVGNEAQITFTPASNYSATGAIGLAITSTTNGESALKFYTYNDSIAGLTEKFRIASNGVCTWSNVGGVAGTAMTLNATGLGVGVSPLARVHSVSNIAAANHDWTSQFVAPTVGFLAASNDSSAWIRIATYNSNPTHDPYLNFLTAGGQNWSIGIDNSDSDKLKVAMAAGFSGSNEFLAIDSSGNVGIGTATPAVKFHVSGSDSILALLNGATKGIRVSFNAAESKIEGVDNTGTGSYQPLSIGGSEIRFDLSNSRKATLDASGNLLVGTTAAKNTASGRGNITIEGTGSAILNLSVNNTDTGYILHDGTNIALDNRANGYLRIKTNDTERIRIKSTGQVNFVGLASDPAGAAGDVVYNSTSNRLKYHNGTAWVNTGTNKYSGALTGTGTSFTVTHNLGTRDVTVAVRKSGSTYDQVFTDVQMTDTNTVTIVFASSVTGSDYTVTVIG